MQYTGQLAMFDLRRQLMDHLHALTSPSTSIGTPSAASSPASPPMSTCSTTSSFGLVTILGDFLMLWFVWPSCSVEPRA